MPGSFSCSFADGEVYERYLEELCSRSLYTSSHEVTAQDRLLALSTDASREYGHANARFVVVARRLPATAGDTADEAEKPTYTINPEGRFPDSWFAQEKREEVPLAAADYAATTTAVTTTAPLENGAAATTTAPPTTAETTTAPTTALPTATQPEPFFVGGCQAMGNGAGNAMIILGIDPGYAIVGWGVIRFERGRFLPVDFGAVITPAGMPFNRRLEIIYEELTAILQKHKPDAAAVEKLYFQSNKTTAIDVAQARGVTMLALQKQRVPAFEYHPHAGKVP